MQYKNTTKSLPEIAKELNVEAVLEGSVIRAGNRVAVTAQLIEAATDRHLWARTYERDLRDVIGLQRALAADVAQQVQLTFAANALPESQRRLEPEVYEAYLKGRYFWNKRTVSDLEKSAEYFQQAIQRDPACALCYAGLADAYTALGFYSPASAHETYRQAKTAALKALELDETLAEARTSLAGVKHKYDLDWAGAEREFLRALASNPNYATAHEWYAIYLQSCGRFDEALAEMQKALSLDPLSIAMRVDRGWILYTARRYDEAIGQLKQALELAPNYGASYFLTLAYAQTARFDEAEKLLQAALRREPQSTSYRALLSYVQALSGKRAEALSGLAALQREKTPAYELALIQLGLGDNAHALTQLERIRVERSSWQPFFNVQPELDALRNEPRFHALLPQSKVERRR